MKLNFFFSSSLRILLDPDENHISITNPLKVLRSFGHIIKNLGLNFVELNRAETLENYLTSYCSDSLQRLFLMCDWSGNTFKYLKKPLKKITDLRIYLIRDQYMKQIQFLNGNNLPNIEKFILESYTETGTRSDFLQEYEKIHLENIEYFAFYSLGVGEYPFFFGNLKHLLIGGSCIVNDALCECIGNVKNLKTLKILRSPFEKPDSIHKIFELENILLNVVDMQFNYRKEIPANIVLQFLKRSRNLKKLSIYFSTRVSHAEYYSNFLQTISSNLGVEWIFHTKSIWPTKCYDDYHIILANMCYVVERINDR